MWGTNQADRCVEQNRPWMRLWLKDLLNYADRELSRTCQDDEDTVPKLDVL